jgi:hypothetical protein
VEGVLAPGGWSEQPGEWALGPVLPWGRGTRRSAISAGVRRRAADRAADPVPFNVTFPRLSRGNVTWNASQTARVTRVSQTARVTRVSQTARVTRVSQAWHACVTTTHRAQRTPHPHPAPRTPHPAPRTPHPAPRTAHPAPRTPHPAPRAARSEADAPRLGRCHGLRCDLKPHALIGPRDQRAASGVHSELTIPSSAMHPRPL